MLHDASGPLENLGVDEFISDDEEEYINANEDEENEDSSVTGVQKCALPICTK